MTRKLLIALVAVFLVAPLAFAGGASAAPKVVREAVVTQLGSDGAVKKTTVAQLIHLEAPAGGEVELRVPKVDDLESYRNLSGFRGPKGEGDDIVWKTSGELDARSLARSKSELPVSIGVRYFLDDAEMSAEEIKRRDGNVRIEIDIENVSGDPKTLEHKAVTSPFLTSVVNQYIPIEYVTRVEFPTDRWSNVGGEGVRVASSDDKEIASASGILSPPLTETSKTLVFEGRSDDILTPRVQIFAVPGLSQDFIDALQEQFEALRGLYDGTGSINENLTKIYQGTTDLVNGVEDLLEGVGTNDERTRKPIIDLGSDGLPTTLLGTLGFLNNALTDDVLPGLGNRDPQTGEGVIVKDEKGNTTTLLGSLQSQKDTYDDTLIPAIEDAIAGVKDFIKQVDDGGSALVGGLKQVQNGFKGLVAALQSGDPNDPGFLEGLQQIQAGLGTLVTQLNGPFRGGMELVSGGLTALILQLDTLFRGGLQQVGGGLTALTTSILTQFAPGLANVDGGLADLLLGAAAFRQGLSDLRDGIAATQAGFGPLDPLLDATLGALLNGANDLVAGFGNTGDPAATIFGGLEALKAGSALLVAGLGTSGSPDTTIVGALETLSVGMAGLEAGLGNSGSPDTTVIGALEAMETGMSQLLAGLGQVSPTPTDSTVIGALQLMQFGMAQLVGGLGDSGASPTDTTLIGALLLMSAGMDQITPGAKELVKGVIGGLTQIKAGFTNPQFTKPQDELDGKTPKEYFTECPACFDPDHKLYDPATADARFQPSLLEVFKLFSEGVEAALPKLHSFDDDAPGLVDGLEQVAGGLGTLASKLHTFDPDDPGLVDGVQLVRGGLQQVSSGIFALNELGIRTMRGQIGDKADAIGADQATLADAMNLATRDSALGADADVVSATYVFDLAAQQTAGNDNLRRGALMALVLAGMVLLAQRMRRFGL